MAFVLETTTGKRRVVRMLFAFQYLIDAGKGEPEVEEAVSLPVTQPRWS
jgi:hypothetical protein